MRRRLRKKLRRGEFREHLFHLAFDVDVASAHDEGFIDAVLAGVERLGLGYGGAVGPMWHGAVQAERGGVTEAQRAALVEWLAAHDEIGRIVAGPLVDGWHLADAEYDRLEDGLAAVWAEPGADVDAVFPGALAAGVPFDTDALEALRASWRRGD